MSLRIITVNARGLQDTVKRRAILQYYSTRADVLCLQERHCTPELEVIWRSEWRGDILFSNGSGTSRGVATYISDKIKFKTGHRLIQRGESVHVNCNLLMIQRIM